MNQDIGLAEAFQWAHVAMDALVIHLGVQELRCSLLCELILMSSHLSGIGTCEKAVDFCVLLPSGTASLSGCTW